MGKVHAQHISDLLFQLKRKLKQCTKGIPFKYELSASQLEVLWYVGMHAPTSMDSIAHYLNIKPPSVTALVDRMEKDGYVLREQATTDRRITNVILSPRMRKEFASFTRQKEATFNKLMDRLSDHDKQELIRILTLLLTDN